MPEDIQIYVTCCTHPELCKPKSLQVSHRHEYAPPAVEADIIQEAEQSTRCLENMLSEAFSYSPEFKTNIQLFLSARRKILEVLNSTPEVRSFINYVLGLEAEIETQLEMEAEEKAVEEILTQEVEELEEVPEKMETPLESGGKEYDNLLDAMCDAIKEERRSTKRGVLQEAISDYVRTFLMLVNWLVEQRNQIRKYGISSQQLRQLLADVISCDVLLVADNKEQLGSERSLVIPLDFSPLRISLALLLSGKLSPNAKNWNRMFCPPILMTWKENIARLVKPYRSLDKHPIMIRIPTFDRDPQRFQEEVQRSLIDFQQGADPLIEKLKGLTPFGKRGTRPSLIRKHLSKAISLYMDYNPFSIENLRVMDLGCGSGVLLKDSYQELFEERRDLSREISIYTLLNDIAEDPGKGLRSASEREDFLDKLKLDIREGDMRDLIAEIYAKKEHFDIAFINRVLDIYGAYGVFTFDKKDVRIPNLFLSTVDTGEIVPYELDNKVVAFSGLSFYNGLWRAIAFLLGQSAEGGDEFLFLPGVVMNAFNNFFSSDGRKGLDLFIKMLDTTELVFVSVFPGSFETVFPLDELHKKNVFSHEAIEPNTYSIIFISKNKQLIDYLASHAS